MKYLALRKTHGEYDETEPCGPFDSVEEAEKYMNATDYYDWTEAEHTSYLLVEVKGEYKSKIETTFEALAK
jgi:hypothetical protein